MTNINAIADNVHFFSDFARGTLFKFPIMNRIKTIGLWSASLSLLFAIAYSIPQILSELKLIPHPQDLVWLFVPSLFLGPAFMVTMISLHYYVEEELKIWISIAVAFSILYTLCATIVYFSQLTVIIPQLLRNEIDETHILAFHTRSFLMAIDCLGYFFMSLSTLFAAFAFAGDKNHKWLYRGLLYNGLLLPVLILAFFYPVFYYVGALWMITFPIAMFHCAGLFQKNQQWNLHLKKIKYETE